MPVNIRHKVNVTIPGLKKANSYLSQELNRAAFKVGDRLQELVRKKQRIDTGEERRRTLYRVTSRKGGLNVLLSVYNTSIQGNVDETGAKPHFPPYKQGSKLFAWVSRKGLANTRSRDTINARAKATRARVRESGGDNEARKAAGAFRRGRDAQINARRIESVAFLVARAISRRGLPRPGDALRQPFEKTRAESENMIRTIFQFATLKAVKKVNDETK